MPFLVRGKARDKRYKPAAAPKVKPVAIEPQVPVVTNEPEVIAELVSTPSVLPIVEEIISYPSIHQENNKLEEVVSNSDISEDIEPITIPLGGSKKKKKEKIYGRTNDE